MQTFIIQDYQHGTPSLIFKLFSGYCLLKTFTGKTAEKRIKSYQRKNYTAPPVNPIDYKTNLVC